MAWTLESAEDIIKSERQTSMEMLGSGRSENQFIYSQGSGSVSIPVLKTGITDETARISKAETDDITLKVFFEKSALVIDSTVRRPRKKLDRMTDSDGYEYIVTEFMDNGSGAWYVELSRNK